MTKWLEGVAMATALIVGLCIGYLIEDVHASEYYYDDCQGYQLDECEEGRLVHPVTLCVRMLIASMASIQPSPTTYGIGRNGRIPEHTY